MFREHVTYLQHTSWCIHPGVRAFDVDGGDHPVQMLLDKFNGGLYEPVQTWLEGIMPDFPHPKDYKFPVSHSYLVDHFDSSFGRHHASLQETIWNTSYFSQILVLG